MKDNTLPTVTPQPLVYNKHKIIVQHISDTPNVQSFISVNHSSSIVTFVINALICGSSLFAYRFGLLESEYDIAGHHSTA